MKKIILSILIVLLIVVGAIFMRKRLTDKTKGNGATNSQYQAMKIVNSSGKAYIDVDGSVEANDTKKVYVNKKLRVKEIFVKEGDFVTKGTLLMTFDENDRNTLKRNIEKERLNLEKLQRNLGIEQKLYKIGGSSRNAVKELEEEVRSSQITIDEYNEDLEKTIEKIESPVDGTIVSLTAEENYAVNTEQPLLEITDLTQLKIVLEVPEYDVINVKIGQKIDIKPEVYEKKRIFKGSVVDIAKVSQESSSTSENILEVEVKPDEQIPNLAPGFKVSGVLYLDPDPEGINIPKTALMEENGKYYVYVINDKSQLVKQDIEIGTVKKGDTVNVTKGLSLGDLLLTTPNVNLKSGDNIKYTLVSTGTGERKKNRGNSGGGPGGGPPM